MVWSRLFPKPPQVNKVLHILDEEYAYFLRLHDIAEKLLARAKKHKESAVTTFRNLELFENREQMFAPVRKLETAIRAMLPIFDSTNRGKINGHATKLREFEGTLAPTPPPTVYVKVRVVEEGEIP